ncbi:MAG: SPFH domain-containing protein [Verrucomicrobia bacterium]|nr:SPFH domain-containing protein [Verrucomicrobiota bacterium]MDA1065397.1 SPFH domain-containing protein [Verrucomicrobiota bacterium]
MNNKGLFSIIVFGIMIVVVLLFGSRFLKTVPAGHVSVATLFGKVMPNPFEEGLHIPVNPLYQWYDFDTRADTITETASVPSQDQLQTQMDVSVKFRINASEAPQTLKLYGDKNRLITTQLIPSLRSTLREAGKTIARAEDFFLEETQNRLQVQLLNDLKNSLDKKGLIIDEVLIRSITLPPFIMKAIEGKKEREQEVEKQKAELERYKTEMQQKVEEAIAERQAAEQEAEKVKLLADARAYEIGKLNDAIADNQAYIQLQSLEALKKIAEDPAAKIYFLDGSSPNPMPLLHMGERQ